mgnify:CR=1 FL=1
MDKDKKKTLTISSSLKKKIDTSSISSDGKKSFSVKKKEPLELPPDFSDIPKPDTLKKDVSKNTEDQKIRKMLNAANKEQENEKKFSTTENSILNKIRK